MAIYLSSNLHWLSRTSFLPLLAFLKKHSLLVNVHFLFQFFLTLLSSYRQLLTLFDLFCGRVYLLKTPIPPSHIYVPIDIPPGMILGYFARLHDTSFYVLKLIDLFQYVLSALFFFPYS